MQLVECIANFSEGRRADVIAALSTAIAQVPHVQLLDVQADAAHHRSVISFAGPAAAVGEAAFQATQTAQQLIDLDQHAGEHPRLGATDVIPFVPLGATSMADCIALAREVGQRIGEELGIAVYLYEQAATRPERRNLADVRRGEYEGWKTAIENDPRRIPDYGPTRATPAGATIVGARQPLIAYNVYLNTADPEIAQAICKAVRYSSGGLRYVKALPMLVDGRAQVSMNLVNYRGTPIHRVVEMIRTEAARFGVTIYASEIVGLVPQEALFAAAVHYLQLNTFRYTQVLETQLGSTTLGPQFLQKSPSTLSAKGALELLTNLEAALDHVVSTWMISQSQPEEPLPVGSTLDPAHKHLLELAQRALQVLRYLETVATSSERMVAAYTAYATCMSATRVLNEQFAGQGSTEAMQAYLHALQARAQRLFIQLEPT